MKKFKKSIISSACLTLVSCILLSACTGTAPAASTPAGGSSTSPSSSAEPAKDAPLGSGLIAATDPSKLPAAAAARKDTLIIGASEFSGVFNPFFTESAFDMRVIDLTFANLLNNDDKGKMVDNIGSMKISDDGLTYTFTVNPSKYSDGSDVKIEDYILSYKIILDKSYDGYSDLTSIHIVGADEYNKGTAKDISGIKILDDHTFEVKLKEPNASAQYNLGLLPPVSTAKYGSLIKQGDLSKFKAVNMVNFVSNGPYILTDYKQGQSATLKSNPNYFRGEPKIKNIIVKVVANDAELQAVITGDVDIEEDVTANQDQIDTGKAEGFINLLHQPNLGYGYVGLNHKKAEFQDQKVRQALLYAIDRKSLNESVYGEYAKALNIPQSGVSWLYTDEGVNPYEYNLDKAAELLKEAGWVKDSGGSLTKDGKPFKIIFSVVKDNAVTNVLLPMMIESYKKLGINLQAEYVDFPTLQTKSQKGNFEMFFMAWQLTADPDISQVYASDGQQNHLFYKNTELDKLLQEARRETKDDKRKELYKQIYQLINKDLPVFPMYQRSNLITYNTRVKNLVSSPYLNYRNSIEKMELQ